MSLFTRYRDTILNHIEAKGKRSLKFPLNKTGSILNDYSRGDFIVIGGRKTSGKSSFILNNYVISPILQKKKAAGSDADFRIKLIYFSTRKTPKATIERMIVNYVSNTNKGTKIGVPSIYGLPGRNKRVSTALSKKITTSALAVFDKFSEKDYLTVVGNKKGVFEIESIVHSSMDQYGLIDDETGEFVYADEYKEMIPIFSVDDITGIVSESGSSNFKNENAHIIAKKLKELAKVYNAVVVLGVPSTPVYIKGVHRSTSEELTPYSTYADRTIVLHNPLETSEKQMLGYETMDFINATTGICYFRTAFIATNYMGASGIYIPYFLYPENGYLLELPSAEDIGNLDEFIEIVNN